MDKALSDMAIGGRRAWSDLTTGGLKYALVAGGGPFDMVFGRNLATEILLG